MLSGEGNENGEKTTIGLITNKKQLCTCCTLFLYISLPLFCTTTTWNFQKLLSHTFFGENVVRVLVHFFFTAAYFYLTLVAASIFLFCHRCYKIFMLFFQQKMSPFFFFISRSRPLSPFFSLSFAGLLSTFSVFLLLYIPNLWTWQLNLSLIL